MPERDQLRFHIYEFTPYGLSVSYVVDLWSDHARRILPAYRRLLACVRLRDGLIVFGSERENGSLSRSLGGFHPRERILLRRNHSGPMSDASRLSRSYFSVRALCVQGRDFGEHTGIGIHQGGTARCLISCLCVPLLHSEHQSRRGVWVNS
jgi:hypothetical protein